MNTENTLLSVGEARKQLGVSSQSIRRFISEGQLIGEKTDTGRWAVESESVRQLLARRKSQHDAKPHATPQAINVAASSLMELRKTLGSCQTVIAWRSTMLKSVSFPRA